MAIIAVVVLGAGGWFIMKTRADNAEKARLEAVAKAEAEQRAEAARLAAAEEVRHAALRGGIIVRTEPSGAEVRVGAIALDQSPLTLKDQKLGRYPVRVRLKGYEDWDGEVDVKENDFAELNVKLVPLPSPEPLPLPLTWNVPSNWQLQPAAGLAVARYHVKGRDASGPVFLVTTFPGDGGGSLANINRWRSQVGLPAASAGEAPGLAVETLSGEKLEFVQLAGTNGQRLEGAILSFEGSTWYFKMSGPADEVVRLSDSFYDLILSIKRSAGFATESENNGTQYTLRPGDTMSKIARAKGVTLDDLLAGNPDVDWKKLRVGQSVSLPGEAMIAVVNQISVAGVSDRGGGECVMLIGNRRFRVGDVISVQRGAETMDLTVSQITMTTFTVRYGASVYTRPIMLGSRGSP